MHRQDIYSKLLISLAVLSLLFFLVSHLMIYLNKTHYADADKKIEMLSKEKRRLMKLEKKLAEYKNFGSEYKAIKQDKFIKYSHFSKFREDLDRLISRYRFLKSSFNFSGKTILKEFIKVKLSIKIEGQYQELKRFIYDIRKTEKFVYLIDSIKLKKSKAGVLGNFAMEVYFVK